MTEAHRTIDLVVRLRTVLGDAFCDCCQGRAKLCSEAADELERYRAWAAAVPEGQPEISRLRAELSEAHQIIRDDVATQEALRMRVALKDSAQRLRSLAQHDDLKCTCVALNQSTYHCEPCRALAAAERYEVMLRGDVQPVEDAP